MKRYYFLPKVEEGRQSIIDIEYNTNKNLINIRKHGLSFETAKAAFNDPLNFSCDEGSRAEVDKGRVICQTYIKELCGFTPPPNYSVNNTGLVLLIIFPRDIKGI